MSKQKKMIIFIIGLMILVLGVIICKRSGIGMDPFNAMCIGLAELLHVSSGTVMLVGNVSLLAIVWFTFRELIGFATIFMAFGFGVIFDIYQQVIPASWFTSDSFWGSLLIFFLGVLVMTNGIALYMESQLGFAVYDCIAYIGEKYFKKPPFMIRMIADFTFAIIGYLVGGPIMIGTVILATSVGPFIEFFRKLYERLLEKEKPVVNEIEL